MVTFVVVVSGLNRVVRPREPKERRFIFRVTLLYLDLVTVIKNLRVVRPGNSCRVSCSLLTELILGTSFGILVSMFNLVQEVPSVSSGANLNCVFKDRTCLVPVSRWVLLHIRVGAVTARRVGERESDIGSVL